MFHNNFHYSDEWRYNDCSSSESEEEREIPPPSKRVGTKRAVNKRTNKTRYSSDDSSVDTEDDKRRGVSRRTAAASVSYKEASEDDKTDSEDLLEVDYQEVAEPVPEEKCETIERILAQRQGKKGGKIAIVHSHPSFPSVFHFISISHWWQSNVRNFSTKSNFYF